MTPASEAAGQFVVYLESPEGTAVLVASGDPPQEGVESAARAWLSSHRKEYTETDVGVRVVHAVGWYDSVDSFLKAGRDDA